MLKHIITGVASALLLTCAPAFAKNPMNGPYATIDGGFSSVPFEDLGLLDTPGSAWGASLGYNFALNNHWALGLEAGYDDNGYVESNIFSIVFFATDNEVHLRDLHAFATVNYLFDSGINIFGKLGAARVFESQQYFNPYIGNSSNDYTYYQPMSSIGIGYGFPLGPNNMNVFLAYSRIYQTSESNTIGLNILKAGLTYQFTL